jgi:ribonuclease P protein component
LLVHAVSALPSSSGGGRMTFPRAMRLLKHADFDRVYQQGRRHFSSHMTVFYRKRESGEGLRVGFTVSRALGGAVDRNRMKRRLREAVRLSNPGTALPVDVVINPKRTLLKAEFSELLKEVARAFEVVEQKSEKGPLRLASDSANKRNVI